jgi:hypothetical protein
LASKDHGFFQRDAIGLVPEDFRAELGETLLLHFDEVVDVQISHGAGEQGEIREIAGALADLDCGMGQDLHAPVRAMVVALGIGQRRAGTDRHHRLHAMLGRLGDGEEAMGEDSRLRPSCTCTSMAICCTPVGWVRPKHR